MSGQQWSISRTSAEAVEALWQRTRGRLEQALAPASTRLAVSVATPPARMNTTAGTLQAAVFVRRRATRIGPYRFGHVGWAFQALGPDGSPSVWTAGSLENHDTRPLCSAERASFWSETVPDLGPLMLARRYDEYKLLTVRAADPWSAWLRVEDVGERLYCILFQNCVNAVTDVLGAFGVRLPSPTRHPVPNHWYDRIPGPSLLVADRSPS